VKFVVSLFGLAMSKGSLGEASECHYLWIIYHNTIGQTALE